MPEHDPEQELGPRISSALQSQADARTGLQKSGMAQEARRRVRKRRQAVSMLAGAVLVAAAIGGVWNLAGGESPVATNSSGSAADSKPANEPKSGHEMAPRSVVGCPADHPILTADSPSDLQASAGLDVNTPVTGLRACRYGFAEGGTGLLGQEVFNAAVAQQVVDAIKVLPERNPSLPVFKCAPQTARPSEAIVLRFDTAAGVREVWVEYDGCAAVGFFTGNRVYGLYAAPLKLFMTGSVRPSGGTHLSALPGW